MPELEPYFVAMAVIIATGQPARRTSLPAPVDQAAARREALLDSDSLNRWLRAGAFFPLGRATRSPR